MAWLNQKSAARYLNVSTRWFRDRVDVTPMVVGEPTVGRRPLMRYSEDDLDAWVRGCNTRPRRSR